MGLVLGVVTYVKNGELQLLTSDFLESLGSQKGIASDYNLLDGKLNLVIFINSIVNVEVRIELDNRLQEIGIPYKVLGGRDSFQVPVARNKILQDIAINHPNSHYMFPDDDDVFADEFSILSIVKYIAKLNPVSPFVTTFKWKGRLKPSLQDLNPDTMYSECAGFINWNMVFSTKFLVEHNLFYNTQLNPPHRSHDTIMDMRIMKIMHGRRYNLLLNPTMIWVLPEDGQSLSRSHIRPDSKLFDAMEYLYSENNYRKIGDIYHYDGLINELMQVKSYHYFRKLHYNDSTKDLKDYNGATINLDFLGNSTEFIIKNMRLVTGIYSAQLIHCPSGREIHAKVIPLSDPPERIRLKLLEIYK